MRVIRVIALRKIGKKRIPRLPQCYNTGVIVIKTVRTRLSGMVTLVSRDDSPLAHHSRSPPHNSPGLSMGHNLKACQAGTDQKTQSEVTNTD